MAQLELSKIGELGDDLPKAYLVTRSSAGSERIGVYLDPDDAYAAVEEETLRDDLPDSPNWENSEDGEGFILKGEIATFFITEYELVPSGYYE